MKNSKRTAQKSGKAASVRGRATSRSTPTTRGRLAPAASHGAELSIAMADALEDILRAERRSRLS